MRNTPQVRASSAADVPAPHPGMARTADDERLATLVRAATRRPSRRSTTATTPRCSRSAANARQPRGRRGRPPADVPARPPRAARRARPEPCGRGCSRSRATAAARCSRRAATAPRGRRRLEPGSTVSPTRSGAAPSCASSSPTSRGCPRTSAAALVLLELGDLSHPEIAGGARCPPEKVKALVFQARAALIAERDARETPCDEIRGRSRRQAAAHFAADRCVATSANASRATRTGWPSAAGAAGSERCSRSRRPPA